jgi:hypothetical protein
MRFSHAATGLRVAVFAWASVLTACSVYDSDLLVGAKPDAVTQLRDAAMATTPLVDSGPALGPDETATPAQPRDAGTPTQDITRCGDGQMTGNETCDVSIPAGEPGACPTECPPLAKCAPRLLNGTACQAECVLQELVCQSGDDCCPGKCTADNDSDCSPSCGDGIIQESRGETCELNTATPCKKTDADCDDHEVCTSDKLAGNPSNCNSSCTNTPITTTAGGDGCCPSGANASTDSDCTPSCGNGVREADEQCDGGNGCDPTCKFIGSPDQSACLNAATTDCEKCACMNCSGKETACRNGTDPTQNATCQAVLDCSQTNNCLGTACFCGPGCIFGGPCWDEVTAAAGSTDPSMVQTAANDASTILGKAYAADSCRVMQCQNKCRPH